MNGKRMGGKLRNHPGQRLPAPFGTGSAYGTKMEAANQAGDQVPIPALADHDRGTKMSETFGVTEDQKDPLVPEGNDAPPAFADMIQNPLLAFRTDAHEAKVQLK